jgi:hypothetical protein
MLLAVASLFGAGVAMAAPAQAASCTYDHVCLYSDSNFTGYKRDDYNSRHNWGIIYYDGTSVVPLYRYDNAILNVSSVDNWDPDTGVSVFYNSGQVGPCFRVVAYGTASNMASVILSSGKQANDVMNSHNFSEQCAGNSYNF